MNSQDCAYTWSYGGKWHTKIDTSSLQLSLFGIFLIMAYIVFLIDDLSNNDHLCSNLSHAHHSHLTHARNLCE